MQRAAHRCRANAAHILTGAVLRAACAACSPRLRVLRQIHPPTMFSSRKAVLAFATLAAAADQAAAFVPAAGSLRLRAPGHQVACQSGAPTRPVAANAAISLTMGAMGDKYGHLRGAEIEPCGAAVERFYKLFGKPVTARSVS